MGGLGGPVEGGRGGAPSSLGGLAHGSITGGRGALPWGAGTGGGPFTWRFNSHLKISLELTPPITYRYFPSFTCKPLLSCISSMDAASNDLTCPTEAVSAPLVTTTLLPAPSVPPFFHPLMFHLSTSPWWSLPPFFKPLFHFSSGPCPSKTPEALLMTSPSQPVLSSLALSGALEEKKI